MISLHKGPLHMAQLTKYTTYVLKNFRLEIVVSCKWVGTVAV